MKRAHLITTLICAAAFAVTVGCKQESNVQPTNDASSNAPAQLDKVKKETKEAVDAAMDYAYAQKEDYAVKIRAELKELNQEIDQLSAKVESSSASSKEEAKARIQELRGKVDRLSEKLDDVQNATESTWEEVKAVVKKGYAEAKDSVDKARQWISEKIAPEKKAPSESSSAHDKAYIG